MSAACRPAPYIRSASAPALASLVTRTGSEVRRRSSSVRCRPTQPGMMPSAPSAPLPFSTGEAIADTYAEHPAAVDAGLLEGPADQHGDQVEGLLGRPVHLLGDPVLPQHGAEQVAQDDPYVLVADVRADRVPRGRHQRQRLRGPAGTARLGLLRALVLGDQADRDQVGDQGGDGGPGQAGDADQFRTAAARGGVQGLKDPQPSYLAQVDWRFDHDPRGVYVWSTAPCLLGVPTVKSLDL